VWGATAILIGLPSVIGAGAAIAYRLGLEQRLGLCHLCLRVFAWELFTSFMLAHAGSCWLTFPVKPQHCSISVGLAVTSSQPHDRGPRFKMPLLRGGHDHQLLQGIFAAILAKCWPFSAPSLMLVSQIWTVVKRMPLTAAHAMHTDGHTMAPEGRLPASVRWARGWEWSRRR
jgi:hypothetical protein